MMYNENILDKWLDARYEELCTMVWEQYYGKIHFDTHLNNILEKYVEIQNEYLANYLDRLKESITKQYPAPKTNEFLVMVKYNQMLENLVHEYMLNEITNILKG